MRQSRQDQKKDTRRVRSSHPTYATDTAFDEQNLLPDAGLVPLLALAERAGLHTLLTDRLTVAGGKGAGHDAPPRSPR